MKKVSIPAVILMCMPLWLHAQEQISKSFSDLQGLEIEGGPLEVIYSGEPGRSDIDGQKRY